MLINSKSQGVYVGPNSEELDDAAAAQIALGRQTPSRDEEKATYPEIIDLTKHDNGGILGAISNLFQR